MKREQGIHSFLDLEKFVRTAGTLRYGEKGSRTDESNFGQAEFGVLVERKFKDVCHQAVVHKS